MSDGMVPAGSTLRHVVKVTVEVILEKSMVCYEAEKFSKLLWKAEFVL